MNADVIPESGESQANSCISPAGRSRLGQGYLPPTKAETAQSGHCQTVTAVSGGHCGGKPGLTRGVRSFLCSCDGRSLGKSPFHASSVLKPSRFCIESPAKHTLLTEEELKTQQPSPPDCWRNSCSMLLLQAGFCLQAAPFCFGWGQPSTHSCGSLQVYSCSLPLKLLSSLTHPLGFEEPHFWGQERSIVTQGCFSLWKVW